LKRKTATLADKTQALVTSKRLRIKYLTNFDGGPAHRKDLAEFGKKAWPHLMKNGEELQVEVIPVDLVTHPDTDRYFDFL